MRKTGAAAWLLAAFLYLNLPPKPDQFDQGFLKGDANREYWTGLFAHGYALCGTTHAQWCAEMNALAIGSFWVENPQPEPLASRFSAALGED